ncbi:MAG: AMP-binding protein, partial [Pseudomonadota bacterium]
MAAPNLSQLLSAAAPRDQAAIIFADGADVHARLSYGELEADVDAVAAGLATLGLPRRTAIGILSGNRPEHFIAYLAILRAGFVAVPINHKLKADGVAHILSDSDVKLTFVDAENESLVAEGIRIIRFDGDGPESWASVKASA